MSKVFHVFQYIQDLQARFHRAALGKDALLEMINEAEVSEQVYNSNAIENSTLSLEETDKILQQVNLNRFVNERELFEAKNLARVVDYINTKSGVLEFSLETICLLHKMLIQNIQDDIAGRFRQDGEWVRVGSHIAVDPQQIVSQLEEVLIVYKTSGTESVISRIALFHLGFEQIHPFMDGNGRIGRVLNNYLLIKAGHVPMNIKFIDRAQYYEAFKNFNEKGDIKIMEQIVGQALCNSYHKRLAYLEGKEIIKLSEYAKKEKLSYPNLLNKAKRQTIEAFWEKGVWKIGV